MPDYIRISAVIPTYNRAHLVGRAIKSVLAQEQLPFEIIVVDDGSADNTRVAVESHGQAVRYVYQANAGVSAARNRGVAEANGDWIAFLDSDDEWVPGHLSLIVRAINDTHGAAAIYFADVQVSEVQNGLRHWDTCGFAIQGEWEFVRDASEWAFMRNQPMLLQASVLSRNAYMKVGGLPDHLRTREDTLLIFKLGLLYPACAVSGCGTVMRGDDRIRLTQVYNSDSLVFHEATIFLWRELIASVKELSPAHRKRINESLGVSYYDMARFLLRRGKYLSGICKLGTAFQLSPYLSIKQARDAVAKCLFGTTVK